MDTKEFTKLAENHIYKEVAKNTNLLLGKNKTAALSTGLFLRLPIEVVLEKSDDPLPTLHKELSSFMNYFGAYVKMDNSLKVFFTFIYHTEKDLDIIMKHIDHHNIFFAFVYLHEVQHILRKHITSSYDSMMLRIAGDIQNSSDIINIAEDHAINYSLKDLFTASPLKAHWADIETIGQYDSKYHADKLSDIEILKELIKNPPVISKSPVSPSMSSVSGAGKPSLQPTTKGSADSQSTDTSASGKSNGKADKCSTKSDELDAMVSDLSTSLQDIISSSTKGSAAGDLFEKLFDSVKVETGWFKKIKASFKRQVYYKTHDYTSSWSNLNSTYRRIYKAPKKQFIDNKVALILSVDHSGSMSTTDLQRLLYLIESESKRISSITVLIHDTRVIKSFDIENDFDIAKSPEFTKALATRYTSGGTSHQCVFEYIQDMKLEDPNKVIYMSFSDNQSDIEQSFGSYPMMRKLTNYWVCVGGNKPVKVPGTNIRMV